MHDTRRTILAALVALSWTLVGIDSASNGAPITFAFEATVSAVAGNPSAIELPFSLALGQQIKGRYSFESEEQLLDIFSNIFPYEIEEIGRLSLGIEGMVIGAAANVGTINEDLIDINGPYPDPSSSISLGYGYYVTDVFPGWGGEQIAGYHFDAGIRLEGPVGTISGVDDVLDVRIWNQLTAKRSLGLSFGYFESNQFKVVTYSASVGNFVAVPEPTTCALVSLAALAFFASRLRL